MDAWMFPLGDELYHHTVSQPLLFINTGTFHWKKNIQQIKELLNNESGRLMEKYRTINVFLWKRSDEINIEK
jgi:hypothetical protein